MDEMDGMNAHGRGKQGGHDIGSERGCQWLAPRYLGTAIIHVVACSVCEADVNEWRGGDEEVLMDLGYGEG